MCVNITNVLNENGHKVILCTTRSGGPLEKYINSGVEYYILHKKNSLDLATLRKLVKIINKNGIELIHAHSSSLFWAILAKLVRHDLKVIWHDHLGLKVNDRRTKYMYKVASRKIDAIITVNNELAAWSRKNMRVSSGKVFMLNNFPYIKEMKRQTDPGHFTIVCLANLRPQKDHETLVKAVAFMANQNLPKKLKVIFAGSDDGFDYSKRIRHLINDFGMEKIIEMPGSVEDTAALLESSDCGVLSSVSEGLPVSLLEYGMAGLPVVVTDVGQCAEVLGKGRYGKIVPPGDPVSLANELMWVINNREEAAEMGNSFRLHVKKEYGPDQFIIKYRDLLTSICQP